MYLDIIDMDYQHKQFELLCKITDSKILSL